MKLKGLAMNLNLRYSAICGLILHFFSADNADLRRYFIKSPPTIDNQNHIKRTYVKNRSRLMVKNTFVAFTCLYPALNHAMHVAFLLH